MILSVGRSDHRFRSLGQGQRSSGIWMVGFSRIVWRSDVDRVRSSKVGLGELWKVAFNYLRENYTNSGQPMVHGLLNFKPELVPDIPRGKFAGKETEDIWIFFQVTGPWSTDPWIPGKGYKTLPTGTYRKQLCICILPNFLIHLVLIEIGCMFFRKAILV